MFDNALNRASKNDVEVITRFVFLSTGSNAQRTDPMWESAESACLLSLISHEITSRKHGRSFKHIHDLVKQGPEGVDVIVTKLLPSWKESSGASFRNGVLAGLSVRLNKLCLADERLGALL